MTIIAGSTTAPSVVGGPTLLQVLLEAAVLEMEALLVDRASTQE